MPFPLHHLTDKGLHFLTPHLLLSSLSDAHVDPLEDWSPIKLQDYLFIFYCIFLWKHWMIHFMFMSPTF